MLANSHNAGCARTLRTGDTHESGTPRAFTHPFRVGTRRPGAIIRAPTPGPGFWRESYNIQLHAAINRPRHTNR